MRHQATGNEESMAREVAATVPTEATSPRPPLAIRSGELVSIIGAVLGLSILFWHYELVQVAQEAGLLVLVACAPFALRALVRRFPASRVAKFVADFGPTGYFFGLYFALNPIADAVNLGIADDLLIRLDQRIFGVDFTLWLDGKVPPLVADAAMLAYTTHFGWPLVLGLVLWFRRKEEAFDEFLTALLFFTVVNYVFYVTVPVMGPRYFRAAQYDGLVPGVLGIAQWVDLAFRGSPFARDCFPSGHTGIALVVLSFAFRHERRFFLVALPVLSLLIAGTLIGRFHYGTDLLAAVPLWLLSLAVARALAVRRPDGFPLTQPGLFGQLRRANR